MITNNLVAAVLLAASWGPRANAAENQTYNFGVVPQQGVATLVKIWQPFFVELSRRSGAALQFATAPDIPAFENRILHEDYDFVYVNPYQYTLVRKNYEAFAREDIMLEGILVVPRECPWRSVKELKDARIAMPSPIAYGATILNKESLREAGLDPEEDVFISYLGSHDGAYGAVASGLADAAGGVQRTFDLLPPEKRALLRVLHRTQGKVPHAFAAHRRVPRDTVKKVAAALTAMYDDERGRAALTSISMQRIIKAQDSDWPELKGR